MRETNRKTFYPIITGLLIIAICNLLGYYFPPFSLSTTFIYMNIIIGVINSNLNKSSFNKMVIYNLFLLLFNDYLIRKFAGGSHDSAGMAWCTVMFGLTILFSFVIMLVDLFQINKELVKSKKEIAINLLVLFVSLLIVNVYYFNIQYKI